MMRRIQHIIFVALIIICSNALAEGTPLETNKAHSKGGEFDKNMKQIYVSPYMGFRHDFFQWSFGVDGLPKLLSFTMKYCI
jgi:hypothetical protein